jgi:hypothetical protein
MFIETTWVQICSLSRKWCALPTKRLLYANIVGYKHRAPLER